MNDQSKTWEPMTLGDTLSVTSSPASESGVTPSDKPDGPTTGKSGPALVLVSRSRRQGKSAAASTSVMTVLIRFLKVWGHPTRNIIMGVGDTARVSEWIAELLIKQGYAEKV